MATSYVAGRDLFLEDQVIQAGAPIPESVLAFYDLEQSVAVGAFVPVPEVPATPEPSRGKRQASAPEQAPES